MSTELYQRPEMHTRYDTVNVYASVDAQHEADDGAALIVLCLRVRLRAV